MRTHATCSGTLKGPAGRSRWGVRGDAEIDNAGSKRDHTTGAKDGQGLRSAACNGDCIFAHTKNNDFQTLRVIGRAQVKAWSGVRTRKTRELIVTVG
jgi:hypothetical protein